MSVTEGTSPQPTPQSTHSSRLLSMLGVVFAVVLVVVLGGAAWAGYQSGLATRAEQLRITQSMDLQAQFNLGVEDLEARQFSRAAARFEYILGLDPNYPGARERLAEAQAGLQVTPTAIPPTPEPVTGEDPAAILAAAQEAADAGNWDAALSQITRLHAVDPDYEVAQAENLAFAALRGRGLARIQGDEMEAGIFDLDQANAFRPLDQDARNYRAWARLYLAAKSYWGLDWARTVEILQQLYVLAPNFKDTSRLLYQATLNWADILNASGDACGAAENYAAAQQFFVDPSVAERLAAAQTNCALTPTPDPAAEATPDPGAEAAPDGGGQTTATP